MSFHADLLEQAEHLARREPRRPRQVSLRRAISDAYYALFHLLTYEAARLFVRDDELWKLTNRVYGHAEMSRVSTSFAAGEWPRTFNPVKATMPMPQPIRNVASAFVDLQDARHDADYNLAKVFARREALAHIARAKQAFADWEAVRGEDLARIYLGCFLLWDKWDKTR
jgi:hypothetical protein